MKNLPCRLLLELLIAVHIIVGATVRTSLNCTPPVVVSASGSYALSSCNDSSLNVTIAAAFVDLVVYQCRIGPITVDGVDNVVLNISHTALVPPENTPPCVYNWRLQQAIGGCAPLLSLYEIGDNVTVRVEYTTLETYDVASQMTTQGSPISVTFLWMKGSHFTLDLHNVTFLALQDVAIAGSVVTIELQSNISSVTIRLSDCYIDVLNGSAAEIAAVAMTASNVLDVRDVIVEVRTSMVRIVSAVAAGCAVASFLMPGTVATNVTVTILQVTAEIRGLVYAPLRNDTVMVYAIVRMFNLVRGYAAATRLDKSTVIIDQGSFHVVSAMMTSVLFTSFKHTATTFSMGNFSAVIDCLGFLPQGTPGPRSLQVGLYNDNLVSCVSTFRNINLTTNLTVGSSAVFNETSTVRAGNSRIASCSSQIDTVWYFERCNVVAFGSPDSRIDLTSSSMVSAGAPQMYAGAFVIGNNIVFMGSNDHGVNTTVVIVACSVVSDKHYIRWSAPQQSIVQGVQNMFSAIMSIAVLAQPGSIRVTVLDSSVVFNAFESSPFPSATVIGTSVLTLSDGMVTNTSGSRFVVERSSCNANLPLWNRHLLDPENNLFTVAAINLPPQLNDSTVRISNVNIISPVTMKAASLTLLSCTGGCSLMRSSVELLDATLRHPLVIPKVWTALPNPALYRFLVLVVLGIQLASTTTTIVFNTQLYLSNLSMGNTASASSSFLVLNSTVMPSEFAMLASSVTFSHCRFENFAFIFNRSGLAVFQSLIVIGCGNTLQRHPLAAQPWRQSDLGVSKYNIVQNISSMSPNACNPLVVSRTRSITATLIPPVPPPLSAAQLTITAVSTIASIAALASAGAPIATDMQALGMLATMQCAPARLQSSAGMSRFAVSPFYDFGNTMIVVGNTSISLGVILLHLGFVAIIFRRLQRQESSPTDLGVVAPTGHDEKKDVGLESLLNKGRTAESPWKDAAKRMSFPQRSHVVCVFLMLGVTRGGASLLFSGSGNSHMSRSASGALGLFGIGWALLVLVLPIATMRWWSVGMSFRWYERGLFGWLEANRGTKSLLPVGRWEPSEERAMFGSLMGAVVESARGWGVLSVASGFVIAMVASLPVPVTPGWCTTQWIAVCVVFLTTMMLHLVKWTLRIPVANFFSALAVALNLVVAIVCTCLVHGVADQTLVTFESIVMVVSLLQTVLASIRACHTLFVVVVEKIAVHERISGDWAMFLIHAALQGDAFAGDSTTQKNDAKDDEEVAKEMSESPPRGAIISHSVKAVSTDTSATTTSPSVLSRVLLGSHARDAMSCRKLEFARTFNIPRSEIEASSNLERVVFIICAK